MATTQPITRSQFLLTISDLDFYWETFSGLRDTAQTSEYSDGLGNRTYKLVGRRTLEDMTLSKAFDPVADVPIIEFWQKYCQGQGVDKICSVTPVQYCPEPEPIGAALILYGFRPISLQGFEVDKKSSDVTMLTLGFVADSWKYQ